MIATTSLTHNLIPYTTRGLIELRGVLLGTLKNEKCKSLDEPVRGSISQINTELSKRGIHSLKVKTK
jgi:hypothetical protein